MAGAAVIGALRVVLGADTAALDKGLKDSQSNLANFGASVGTAMLAVSAAVTAAAASIGVAIKGVIDNADRMNKVSQSTGLTTEELSKLKYAADLSDISMESLGKSLGKLSKAMVAAGTDSASQAGRAFVAMGIDVKNQDGTLRDSSDVLKDIAEKFAGYKDGAEKTSLAIALFGKAGAAMIPLLNQGKDGLNDLGDEAQKFGLVLDKQTTMAAEAFNDNLKKMAAIKEGLYTTITARLLPALEQLSAEFLDAKKNSDFTSTAADVVTTAIRVLGSEVTILIEKFRAAGKELMAFKDFLAAAGDIDDLKAAWNRWTLVVEDNENHLSELKASLGTLAQNLDSQSFVSRFSSMTAAIAVTTKETKRLQAEAAKTTAPGVGDTTEQKNALQVYLDSQAKKIASQNAETATIGQTADAQARLKVMSEAKAIEDTKAIVVSDKLRASITATATAAAAAAIALQGATLTQEMLAPWDLRNQKLQQYNTLLQAGAISQATFSAAAMKVQFPAFTAAAQASQDFGAAIDQLSTNALNGLASTLASVVTGAKSAGEAFSAFALQIITQLAEMIIKAVLFKIIMTAIGFSGGGAVGSIVTGGPDGPGTFAPMATGGAVMGAGTATSDSIPAMLSNGEFVVNAAATKQFAPLLSAINSGNLPSFKDGGSVSGVSVPQVAAPQMVTVQMNGKVFDRATLAELIGGLNNMFRNGYKLEIA